MASVNFKIEPNKRAAEVMREKTPTLPDVFKKMDAGLRGRAFTVAKIQDFDVLQSCRDAIEAAVSGGVSWKEARSAIAAQIEYEFADPEAALAKAELVLQTNAFQAFASANYMALMRIKASHPYWEYRSERDGRVRESHQALGGKIIPADDDFWLDHFPPWDWGCRCDVIGRTRSAVERINKADADKPQIERRVLDSSQLQNLRNGVIRTMTPAGPIEVSVATPVQRAETEAQRQTAYRFNPRSLALDTDKFAKRYDPDIGDLFKKAVSMNDPGKAETVEEAKAFAKGRISDNVRFESGVGLDTVNRMNAAVSQNMAELGIGRLDTYATTKETGSLAFVRLSEDGTEDEFHFNSGLLSDTAKAFDDNVAKPVREGRQRHLAVDFHDELLQHIVNHEFGHLIMRMGNDNRKLVKGVKEKAIRNGDIDKISAYARQDELEFFGEVFAMYRRGVILPEYITRMIWEVTK